MPDPLLRVAAALLGATFAWAAVAKLLRWRRWRDALRAYLLPARVAQAAAPLVPALELAAAALVLSGRTKIGAALAVVLLAGFSAAVLHAQQGRGGRLPCGCFGRATERDYRFMLVRNALLGALAAVLLLARDDVRFVAKISAPSAREAIPAALVVLGIAVCLWVARHAFASLAGKRPR